MIRITIQKQENGRGLVTRTVEVEEHQSISNIIGVLDGIMRQSFPRDMRQKTLNLSRNTSTAGEVIQGQNAVPPNLNFLAQAVTAIPVDWPEHAHPYTYNRIT